MPKKKRKALKVGRWYVIQLYDHQSITGTSPETKEKDPIGVVVGRFLKRRGKFLEFTNFAVACVGDEAEDVDKVDLFAPALIQYEEIILPFWAYKERA